MNYYPNYNQVYGPQMQGQIPRVQPVVQQPIEQQYPQYVQPQPLFKQPTVLQGKSVDGIEVVKAMDIPLDGSVSYFPLADGTAIVTKQLQQDGSSKTVIYRPVEEKEVAGGPEYVTIEEFRETVKKLNNDGLKEEIKTMKRQIRDISKDMRDISDEARRD